MNESNNFQRLFQKGEELVFHLEDNIAKFYGRPKRELYEPTINFGKLFEVYNLKPGTFNQKLANLINPNALRSEELGELYINWVTSVDVIALRTGYFNKSPFTPLLSIGVVETADNKILIGTRGGAITEQRVQQFASGLWDLPPTEVIPFKSEYQNNLINDSLEEGFIEEVGFFEVVISDLIGVTEVFSPGPTGLAFISKLKTSAELYEIQLANIMGNKFYREQLQNGLIKKQAKEVLKIQKLPESAWEHPDIFGIENDLNIIDSILTSIPQVFSGVGYGALSLYAEHLKQLK